MNNITIKKLYEIHSWVGVFAAIFMFIIAFTGSVAVFGSPELKLWAHPSTHHYKDIDPNALETLIQEHAEELGAEYWDHIDIILPATRRSDNLIAIFERELFDENGRHQHYVVRFEHDPNTLEQISRIEGSESEVAETSSMDMADFIIRFHADLHLPNPWGLIITGLMGLLLVASIVTGLVIHRKIFKELFTFRPFRSLRLLFTDTHKVLGVWGVLFHTVIALSGAFLGIAAVLLIPAAAMVSFGGDQEALVEAVLPQIAPDLSGEYAELSLAPVLREHELSTHGPIVSLSLLGGKDSNALAVVNSLAGDGVAPEILEYNAQNGELLARHTTYSNIGGMSGPVLDVLRPLHYGDFGGLFTKLIWGVLGISTSLLALTGMMIWLERRTFGPTGKLRITTYQRISRFTVGICTGLVLATSTLFYSQRLLQVGAQDLGFWIGVVFFGSWVACTLWTSLRKNEYISAKLLLGLTGALLAGIPFLNALTTGNHLLNVASLGHYVIAGVDFSLLLLASLFIWLAVRIPNQRPIREKRTSDTSIEISELDIELSQ